MAKIWDVLNQRQGFISSLQSLIFHAGLANSNSSAVSDYRAWLSWKSSDTMEFARNGFKRKNLQESQYLDMF
jgi:hypothetical protein